MIISRSEITTIDECQLKAFQTYREQGTGFAPAGAMENIITLQGIALHKGIETIFNKGPQSDWKNEIKNVLAVIPDPAQRHLRIRLVTRAVMAWKESRYEQLIAEWEPLGSEVPWSWNFAPGFTQPLRLDNLFRHRDTGGLAIWDGKTAGSPDLNWTNRKAISKQTHLYLKALKDKSQQHVMGIIYDCVVLGKWDRERQIHKSPMTLGYKDRFNTVHPKYTKGFPQVDLCEWDDDQWMKWAQDSKALEGLVWTTGLINPTSEQLIQTQEATGTQAVEWAAKLAEVDKAPDKWAAAKRLFPRNPEACLQFGWDYACPFYNRCWKGHALDGFEPRKDHHEATE